MDKYYSPNKEDDIDHSHMSFEEQDKNEEGNTPQMEQRRNSVLPMQNNLDGVDYGDEEVFFDSRVVKTVRNLKRIRWV